jgi:hypothetical protein
VLGQHRPEGAAEGRSGNTMTEDEQNLLIAYSPVPPDG